MKYCTWLDSFFFFKQKTAYEMRISDWRSDVCSSDLTRRGQMDIACAQCHEQNAGNSIGVENLSQGRSNGYPAYRLKWQSFGSLHRRFEGCNQEVRAQP